MHTRDTGSNISSTLIQTGHWCITFFVSDGNIPTLTLLVCSALHVYSVGFSHPLLRSLVSCLSISPIFDTLCAGLDMLDQKSPQMLL